jgi:hypothetical protein
MRLLAIAIGLFFTSCASIMEGSASPIDILSTPPGAYFETNTGASGTTPATITVPNSVDLEIEFAKRGYESTTVEVPSEMSPWILGNVLFGGIVGIIIDAVNPDARSRDSSVTVELRRNVPAI